MTWKNLFVGKESGKSSNRWFGNTGHPKGYGASTGDGRTTDKTIAGKIVPTFKKPPKKKGK